MYLKKLKTWKNTWYNTKIHTHKTHMHTCTHTCTHTHMHTHTHKAHTHAHMHTQSTHTYTQAHKKHTHTHTCTQSTHTHTYTHAHTRTHTHTHAHTRTHTYTHTHTHTHTPCFVSTTIVNHDLTLCVVCDQLRIYEAQRKLEESFEMFEAKLVQQLAMSESERNVALNTLQTHVTKLHKTLDTKVFMPEQAIANIETQVQNMPKGTHTHTHLYLCHRCTDK